MIRLAQYYQQRYGKALFKLPVNAGFPCPHGGCTFCANRSFSTVADATLPVVEQVEQFFENESVRHRDRHYLVYFQTYTATNGTPQALYNRIRPLQQFRRIRGICLGTRPDCIDRERLDAIRDAAGNRLFVEIEYGLQSAHNRTLRRLNRGHGAEDFVKAVHLTNPYGFDIGAHVILFLPGESVKDMLITADFLRRLPIRMLKIHSLYLVQGTPLYEEYRRRPFFLPTVDDYIAALAAFLRRLPADLVVSRICSDTRKRAHTMRPWTVSVNKLYHMLEQTLNDDG